MVNCGRTGLFVIVAAFMPRLKESHARYDSGCYCGRLDGMRIVFISTLVRIVLHLSVCLSVCLSVWVCWNVCVCPLLTDVQDVHFQFLTRAK